MGLVIKCKKMHKNMKFGKSYRFKIRVAKTNPPLLEDALLKILTEKLYTYI